MCERETSVSSKECEIEPLAKSTGQSAISPKHQIADFAASCGERAVKVSHAIHQGKVHHPARQISKPGDVDQVSILICKA